MEPKFWDQTLIALVLLSGKTRNQQLLRVPLTSLRCYPCRRNDCQPSLLDWQSISNEVCNSTRRRRIQVRQHSNHITWPGADLQLAIHPRRATAMPEASRPVNPVNRSLLKSIRIPPAVRCLDFSRREHLGVLPLE